MDIQETPDGILLKVKVKPNSPKFCLGDDGTLEIKSVPKKGNANREIIKGLKRLFGCNVRILVGHTSRDKMLLIEGIDAERLKSVLRDK